MHDGGKRDKRRPAGAMRGNIVGCLSFRLKSWDRYGNRL